MTVQKIRFSVFLTLCFFFLFINLPVSAQGEIPKCQFPIFTTSAGQSPDVNTLNIILEEAEIKYDYCDVPTVEMMKKGVGLGDKQSGKGFHVEVNSDLTRFPKGTPYKTAMFAIGASLKGMGASGLTVEDEVKRVKLVIDYCRANKIIVVAVHLGGLSKRGAAGSDNESMIDAVAPFADWIVVLTDSNKDKRFDKIAQNKKVPLTQIQNALEFVDIIKKAVE